MADHKNIWQYISIPPVCVRPSVQQDGASNEDDLTIKLRNNGSSCNLQVSMAIYINSETPGIPLQIVTKFNLQLQFQSESLVMGYLGSMFAVIGPTTLPVASKDPFYPNLPIDEVASPEQATSAAMRNGCHIHPGTNYVANASNGFKKSLKFGWRDQISGWRYVERLLMDGDQVCTRHQHYTQDINATLKTLTLDSRPLSPLNIVAFSYLVYTGFLVATSVDAAPMLQKHITQTITDSTIPWVTACQKASGADKCNTISKMAFQMLLAASGNCDQQNTTDQMPCNTLSSLQVFQTTPQNSELNGFFHCQGTVVSGKFRGDQTGDLPLGVSTVNPTGSCPVSMTPVPDGEQLQSLVTSPGTHIGGGSRSTGAAATLSLNTHTAAATATSTAAGSVTPAPATALHLYSDMAAIENALKVTEAKLQQFLGLCWVKYVKAKTEPLAVRTNCRRLKKTHLGDITSVIGEAWAVEYTYIIDTEAILKLRALSLNYSDILTDHVQLELTLDDIKWAIVSVKKLKIEEHICLILDDIHGVSQPRKA
ncbi:hypothetical protein K439DRAFT_1547380 [Ramaria rubella]|nr:hypothetical protein K439DRAFT_1547380 [Ramaria rubella]